MRIRCNFNQSLMAASLILIAAPAFSQQREPELNQEVLSRGPIHEAFAQPVVFEAEAGSLVSREPPEPIEELPPEQKPDSADVYWVSGYWAWDAEGDDFIWVSGIWRNIPPGLQWTPGYWTQVADGWQWISGYWSRADVEEVEYLPEPPENVEGGPSTEAPADDYVWNPGHWVWLETRYVWRPGYWIQVRPGWIWCPAHYVYTPRGYLYIDGYWDYAFDRRGVIFAPVRFAAVVIRRPTFVYVPRIVIDVTIVINHFFVFPRYRHYMFGDFYAANYFDRGVYPWFSFHMSRYGFDPAFAYYRRRLAARDANWEARLRAQFRLLREQERLRPARTMQEQAAVIANVRKDQRITNIVNVESFALAKPLADIAARAEARFERINENERKQTVERSKALRQAATARAKIEVSKTAKPRLPDKPTRVERPKSPIVPKAPTTRPRADQKPPPRPEAPKVDPKVKPKAGKPRVLPRPENQLEEPKKKKVDPPVKPKPKVDPKKKDDPPVKPKPKVDPKKKDDPPVKPKKKDEPPDKKKKEERDKPKKDMDVRARLRG